MAGEFPDPIITRHAKRRFKERMNLPPRAAYATTKAALTDGADIDALPWPSQRRLHSMIVRHSKPGEWTFPKIYRGAAFIFKRSAEPGRSVLITVLPFYELEENAKQ